MSTSRLRAFGATLLGACCSMLILVSTGGAANGGNFILGVTTNSATLDTVLNTTAPTGLYVNDTGPSAVAIRGGVSASGLIGVFGVTSSSGTSSRGVEGLLNSSSPGASSAAVVGFSTSTTANGPGVWGDHSNGSGRAPGVLGHTSSTATDAAGVKGTINSSADYSAGVRGENANASCCGFGVVGFSAGQGIGIGGYAPNGFGVFGYSPYNWAAWLDGAVTVTKDLHVYGTLYKGGGAFRIDHPLDPAHSYLQHSFVESPDMKNIYDGNVTTNAKGFAVVNLPAYFQVLNRDFRYQLTPIGHNAWDARAVVWNEIKDSRFTIRSEPHVKISWQVTGIRHDAYANAHRIQVVVPKTGADAGKYAYPGLYGQPKSKGVTALPGMPKAPPRLKAQALPKQR